MRARVIVLVENGANNFSDSALLENSSVNRDWTTRERENRIFNLCKRVFDADLRLELDSMSSFCCRPGEALGSLDSPRPGNQIYSH